jgi:hypothetical protein
MGKAFEGEAGFVEERVRQLIYFSSRRFYLARQNAPPLKYGIGRK